MPVSSLNTRRRLSDGFAMFVVMWLSMLCLIYVAYGEATRTFERFQGDKLAGQAQVVENAMESVLRSGLGLKQFIGFAPLANQILESDKTISSMIVTDASNELVFSAGDAAAAKTVLQASAILKTLSGSEGVAARVGGGEFALYSGADHYWLTVPLEDKFERVGELTIAMPTAAVTDEVWTYFDKILSYSFAPALFFAMIIVFFGARFQKSRMPWAQIIFALIFLASAALVITVLVALYSQGAQAKAQALAESLGQRLSLVIDLGLNLNEIRGIDRVLSEYLTVNPDLSSAALTVDEKIVIHTDPSLIGQTWLLDQDSYQYVVDLTKDSYRNIKVAVELPSEVVISEILRSVKNFGALFIASAFLANLFFQVGGATVRRAMAQPKSGVETPMKEDWLLDYVKPVFFLGVLSEHLTYAFLPQHVKAIAIASGVPEAYAMGPFTLFYLAFALTLIPAGWAAQRFSPRPLMYLGLLFASLGLFGTAWSQDFFTLVAARGLAGVGQGMLFIGVQSYLLAAASENNKTQASAIIVYGFQGGMISGMAVGSLLVGSMGPQGVFALSSLIACAAAVYAISTVPSLTSAAMERISKSSSGTIFADISRAFGNRQFMGAMISIGMPAKAVLTGVISFALPLLLSQSLYAQEDIGQIIMIYALAVVGSSQLIAPYVDRVGDSRQVLLYGTTLSGVGLLMVAAGGVYAPQLEILYGEFASTALLVSGIGVIGVAHGFINAPVVTYIAGSKLAGEIGSASATSAYRFLERIGHVAGPVVIGQMFLWFADDWAAIGVMGATITMLGLLWFSSGGSADRAQEVRRQAQA